MSYWNRPFFPELCSGADLDDSVTYDTMVRIGGSWIGTARAFKAVADHYGWTHIVVVSDDTTSTVCWYGARPFDDVFGHNKNYTFSWLRLVSRPTEEQIDEVLQEIRSLTRGSSLRSLINYLSSVYISRMKGEICCAAATQNKHSKKAICVQSMIYAICFTVN